ncbi:MAG: hypothetical protein ABIH19_01700 [Candidatus Omnitrophota bacterium]
MLKRNFFDRQAYLEILEKRSNGLLEGYRQNLAIIGDEFVGKTSIIYKFLQNYSDNRIIPLYLEIRPEPPGSFTKRFIGVLLFNFLSNSGIPLKEDLDYLIRKSERYIPRTIEKAKLILSSTQKRKTVNTFADLLSLCEIIHLETGKSTVVIFDEFHNLEGIGIKNLYRDWSKILITQKNTMHVITSSMKFKAKSILAKNLSLLFGNFEVINVEPFDIKTSEEYLNDRLCGLNIDAGIRNFLVHFTGGYPFYLEVITEAMQALKSVELADLLEGLLFDTSGILSQRFSNYIKRFMDSAHSNDYISMLYLISSGHNKIKDIAHIMKKQKKEIDTRINRLLELDTVTRSGDFLKINDRVFGFWLKFVYQEKLHALTFDARKQKAIFRDYIAGLIRDFLANTERPITERVSELLNLFQDETMQMERKKIRLHHFREIKPLEFKNSGLKHGLIGRSSDSLWIMAIKDDLLTEEDISEFADECKKYKHKLQRKIIVTLKDIDANTRLKALEEKIWTWDINNLNQILDLFFKPRVIA